MATAGDAIADVLMGPLSRWRDVPPRASPRPRRPAALPASNLVESLKVAAPARLPGPAEGATRTG